VNADEELQFFEGDLILDRTGLCALHTRASLDNANVSFEETVCT
jgi:hypothetical protein